MSLLKSLSVTFFPPIETIEDMALGGTHSQERLFLWTNEKHQALTGACFCRRLLCLCLHTSTALLGCKQVIHPLHKEEFTQSP